MPATEAPVTEVPVSEVPAPIAETMSLLDWRRRIAELYTTLRAEGGSETAWRRWCDTRAELFASHPQSPLPPGRRDELPRYFDHDPSLRTTGRIVEAEPLEIRLPGSLSETFPARRFGVAEFALRGLRCRLDLFWLDGYAGGLLVPFRDATSGNQTYGGGRYLLDTSKGADLGGGAAELVLDFNFAYQPSCSYDPRWSCPLSPPGSILPLEIRAGERL